MNSPTARPVSTNNPSFSIPSIIAAVCTVLIFATEWFDMLFGILAIIFGLIGAGLALLPSVRGGIISIVSIILGVLAIITSFFQVIFR